MEDAAAASPTKETGGIFIGTHQGVDILISKATDAGPNAKRSECGFLRDTAYCQSVLDAEYSVSGADYVGEWHTHVVQLPQPSTGDLATLAGIILDPDYRLPSFSMGLGVVSKESIDFLFYMVTIERRSLAKEKLALINVSRVVPSVKRAGAAED